MGERLGEDQHRAGADRDLDDAAGVHLEAAQLRRAREVGLVAARDAAEAAVAWLHVRQGVGDDGKAIVHRSVVAVVILVRPVRRATAVKVEAFDPRAHIHPVLVVQAEALAQQPLQVRQHPRVIDQVTEERLVPGQKAADARIRAVVPGHTVRMPVDLRIQPRHLPGRQHVLDHQKALQVKQIPLQLIHA